MYIKNDYIRKNAILYSFYEKSGSTWSITFLLYYYKFFEFFLETDYNTIVWTQ